MTYEKDIVDRTLSRELAEARHLARHMGDATAAARKLFDEIRAALSAELVKIQAPTEIVLKLSVPVLQLDAQLINIETRLKLGECGCPDLTEEPQPMPEQIESEFIDRPMHVCKVIPMRKFVLVVKPPRGGPGGVA